MKPLTVADVVARIDTQLLELLVGPRSLCANERRDELRVLRAWIVRGGQTAGAGPTEA